MRSTTSTELQCLAKKLERDGVKSPRRFAALATLCGAVALGGWFAGLGSLGIESSGPPIEVSRASATARAEHVDAPQATAMDKDDLSVTEMGSGTFLGGTSSPQVKWP
jgi:hypothetical protein